MPTEAPDPPYGEMGRRSGFEKGRFLTPTQRDYLTGEHDPPTDNAESTMRSKIRERTVGAILELGLVSRSLGERDRELIFNYAKPEDISEYSDMPGGVSVAFQSFDEAPIDRWEWLGLENEFSSMLEFFYKTARENGVPRSHILKSLEMAVEAAEGEWGIGFRDVTVDLSVEEEESLDLDALAERYKRGEDLSLTELGALAKSDRLNTDLSE